MHPKLFVGRALPGPAGGAYSAPQTPLLDLRGPTSKEGEGRRGVGKGGRGREGKGRGRPSGLPLHIISGYATGNFMHLYALLLSQMTLLEFKVGGRP